MYNHLFHLVAWSSAYNTQCIGSPQLLFIPAMTVLPL